MVGTFQEGKVGNIWDLPGTGNTPQNPWEGLLGMQGHSGVHLGSPPPAAPTMPGALPDLPSDPGHGLGAHLGAEIPVKGGGAASLCRENLR